MPDDTPCMVEYDTAQAILTAALNRLLHDRVETVTPPPACARVSAEELQARSPRPEAGISALDRHSLRLWELHQSGPVVLPAPVHCAPGS